MARASFEPGTSRSRVVRSARCLVSWLFNYSTVANTLVFLSPQCSPQSELPIHFFQLDIFNRKVNSKRALMMVGLRVGGPVTRPDFLEGPRGAYTVA